MNRKVLALAATLFALSSHLANADLVYDQPVSNDSEEEFRAVEDSMFQEEESEKPRIQDRSNWRDNLSSSYRAQSSVQSEPVVIENQSGGAVEVRNLSKSELLRRERMRRELENEDLLQERLESIRLKDEKRRTNRLIGDVAQEEVNESELTLGLESKKPMQVQALPVENAYIGDEIQRSSSATVENSSASAQSLPAVPQMSQAELPMKEKEASVFYVSPRGGLMNFSSNEQFETTPKYSFGLALGMEVNDHFSAEVSYSRSEVGISSKFAQNYGYSYYGSSNSERFQMTQNVYDLGVKLHVLNRSYKFRPFVGIGGGYGRTSIDYSDSVQSYYKRYGVQGSGKDYEMSSFLGSLSTGFDIELSKSITLGAMFKYHQVFSSSQESSINYNAFYPYYGNSYASEWEKRNVGDEFSEQGFYTLTAGIGFRF